MSRLQISILGFAALFIGIGATSPEAGSGPAAPPPTLSYAFSVEVEVAPAIEQGESDGGRRRFIAITGGKVFGPKLQGVVLPGGGDWQTIMPGGLTKILARYFLKAADGTVVPRQRLCRQILVEI